MSNRGKMSNGIQTKVLEVRDSGTFIGVLAIRMMADLDVARRHLWRVGFVPESSTVVVMRLGDQKATSDPYEWPEITGCSRTMPVAHKYIQEHFAELKDGDVVDVEYILGITATKKTAEIAA